MQGGSRLMFSALLLLRGDWNLLLDWAIWLSDHTIKEVRSDNKCITIITYNAYYYNLHFLSVFNQDYAIEILLQTPKSSKTANDWFFNVIIVH